MCSTLYTPLHVHSHFSLTAGVPSPKELVQKAKEMGFKTLALTDTNTVSGLILFLEEARKAEIKPILGVELVNPDDPDDLVVLLARNAEGYGDICELTTRQMYRLHDKKQKSTQGISAGVHCRTADLFKKELYQGRTFTDLVAFTPNASTLDELAGTPLRNVLHAELINTDEYTRKRSRECYHKAKQLGLPLIAQHPVWFLERQDYGVHLALRAIHLNAAISAVPERLRADEHAWMQPAERIMEKFAPRYEWLAESARIADSCRDTLKEAPWILPVMDFENTTPDAVLRGHAFAGLENNYAPDSIQKETYEQARKLQEKELKLIREKGYSSYFLTVKKIRDWAGAQFTDGYRHFKDTTILRGSAANSMTLYNIGASDLDPIEHDLYFERFLNEDRASPPDADLDFGWDEREQALEWMFKEWGEDHTAIICTTNSFRWRSAFRETAKVFGYGDSEITTLYKELRKHTSQRRMNLNDMARGGDSLSKVLEIARRIHGKPRHLGQHPGGVIITQQPIWRHVGCQYSGGGRRITQIDMHNGIDYLGLIKYDILGNGSLSVLRDSLHMLEEQGFPDPELHKLQHCYDDPKVHNIMRNGQTRGVFYIESPAQTRLNRKAGAETFEEIGITSSLVRPAGAPYTSTFVDRHRGDSDWDFLHPSLRSILGETHDVLVFQEDIIKLCVEVAHMSFKQADQVRKMMNSLHEGEAENYHETAETFMQGCMRHSDFSRQQAEELWDRVNSFRGFSFCKSHSLSYAQLSFKCAWLKAHYPAQFLAAVIRNQHGFYSSSTYLDEARRWGIAILPPDVNHSLYHTFGYSEGHSQFIRIGFQHLHGLPRKFAERVVEERLQNGPYRQLLDFRLRNSTMGTRSIESLIRAGSMDDFGLNRPALLLQLFALDKGNKLAKKDGHDFDRLNQRQLTLGNLVENELPAPDVPDYSTHRKCTDELHYLGFMTTVDALDVLRYHPARQRSVLSAHLSLWTGKRIKIFGTPIARRTHRVSKSQEMMLFLTLQDETGTTDVVFWPKQHERLHAKTYDFVPMEIWGKVEEEQGTHILVADDVKLPGWSPGKRWLSSVETKPGLAPQTALPWNTSLAPGHVHETKKDKKTAS